MRPRPAWSRRLGADTVRIGCGSGFWGDAFDPAMELLEGGALDALSFDFLAELTMALLQRARARDPQAGYIEDAVDFMTRMAATARQRRTRLVSNGGGVNPRAAAQELCRRLRDTGLAGTKIGIVSTNVPTRNRWRCSAGGRNGRST